MAVTLADSHTPCRLRTAHGDGAARRQSDLDMSRSVSKSLQENASPVRTMYEESLVSPKCALCHKSRLYKKGGGTRKRPGGTPKRSFGVLCSIVMNLCPHTLHCLINIVMTSCPHSLCCLDIVVNSSAHSLRFSWPIVAKWRNIVAAACCVKSLYFPQWKNSPKFKMLWFFESRHHHLLESWGVGVGGWGWGDHFDEKKTHTFLEVVGRKRP